MSTETTATNEDTVRSLVERVQAVFTAPPRCHLFRTDRREYAYDANTGEIIACDPVSVRIIQKLGRRGFAQFVRTLIQEYGCKPVADSLSEVLSLSTKRQPALLSTKPPRISYYLDFESFRQQIDRRLERMCVALTNACSLACKYCIYSGAYPCHPPRGRSFMDRETLQLCLKYFAEHSVESEGPNMAFYGGEPLLAPPLIRYAVDYLRSNMAGRPYTLSLTTNFLRVSGETMSLLRDHNFLVFVSLDGPKDINDRYRVTADGRGAFERVAKNLRALKRLDEDFYDKNVIIKSTLVPPYRYPEVRSFLENDELIPKQSVGFQVSHMASPEIVFRGRPARFFDKAGLAKLKQEYLELAKQGKLAEREWAFLKMLFEQAFLYVYRRRRPNPTPDAVSPSGICVPGQRKILVKPNGDFYPCEKIPEYKPLKIGNCRTGVDIEKAYKLCRDHINLTSGECSKCWAVLFCSEICFRNSFSNNGLDQSERLSCCARLREYKSALLSDLCSVLEENPAAFRYMDEITIS